MIRKVLLPFPAVLGLALALGVLFGIESCTINMVMDPAEVVWTKSCPVIGSKKINGNAAITVECGEDHVNLTDDSLIVAHLAGEKSFKCTRTLGRVFKNKETECVSAEKK